MCKLKHCEGEAAQGAAPAHPWQQLHHALDRDARQGGVKGRHHQGAVGLQVQASQAGEGWW